MPEICCCLSENSNFLPPTFFTDGVLEDNSKAKFCGLGLVLENSCLWARSPVALALATSSIGFCLSCLSVSVAGTDLPAADDMKVLGVVLDRRLSFDRHATSVAIGRVTSTLMPSDTSAIC